MKNMIKRTSYYAVLASLLATSMIGFTSCEDEDNEEKLGNWVNAKAMFPGVARGGAVCFQIGNEAYVGTGANTKKTEDKERFRDFYKCYVTGEVIEQRDKTTGAINIPIAWTEKWDRSAQGISSMPEAAPARNGGVAFSINGKGYVGLGYDGKNYLKDFWEFDPNGTPNPADYPSMPDELKANFTNTGSWKRIADYPGDSCRYAVAFVIDNVAYVGGGQDYDDNVLGDFYKYDGTKWTSISNIKSPRMKASAFVAECGGKKYGYVVGGCYGNSLIYSLECYDPEKNEWINKRDIKNSSDYDYDDDYNIACYGATSFVLGNKAYVATGGIGAGRACWEYDVENDYWIQKTSFEGEARIFAVSYVLDFGGRQVPFVTTGADGEMLVTSSGGNFYPSTYLFNPYEYWEDKDN